MLCFIASLLLAAPVAAAAAAEEAEVRDWSVGAGFELSATFGNFETAFLILGLGTPSVPAATVSIEHRIGRASHVVLGVSGGYSKLSSDPQQSSTAAGVTAAMSRTQATIATAAGVRTAFGGADAPVTLSVFGLARFGHSRISSESSVTTGGVTNTTRFDASATGFGASGGVSVERTLLDALSLRISATILSITFTSIESSLPAPGTLGGTLLPPKSTNLSVALDFQPSLELRLAF